VKRSTKAKTMDDQPQQWVRWYDRYPNLSIIMKITEHLPKSIQLKVAETLFDMVTQYYTVLDTAADLKSLGPELVMSLNKSHRKQRWYDAIPQLHKALNMMLVMPEPLLFHLDERCTKLREFVQEQQRRLPPPPPRPPQKSAVPNRPPARKPYHHA
jgi:hypothetical protein